MSKIVIDEVVSLEKVKLKDITHIYFIGNVTNSKKVNVNTKWIMPNLLDEDIGTCESTISDNYDIQKSVCVEYGDIIIKRVNPKNIIFNDQKTEDTYAYSNLIVIKVNDHISKKYIACLLEKELKKIIKLIGNTIPSIERKELEMIEIKKIPEANDVGNLWYLNKKNRFLKDIKAALEKKKNEIKINSYLMGGN